MNGEGLYLIAHVVRGEPTMDIALRVKHTTSTLEEYWWILSTGHRAKPYWTMAYYELGLEIPFAPLDHPDFFSVNDTKPKTVDRKPSTEATLEDIL